ncbi:MAG: nickel pincer cofactor biosynthesis protein LarB [Clostridiales bacterium]|nr:nickel pincer cofactor biosynthesis protein LarB [Clostridiales bacterium]
MKREELKSILNKVKSGEIEPEEAEEMIRLEPFVDLGYARPDTHRELTQGAAEVIYGEGKSAAQIAGIAQALLGAGQERVLITRLAAQKADELSNSLELEYFDEALIGLIGGLPEPVGDGKVAVVTGGTSDCHVAEEAALTAEALGSRVQRIYDVGVAGIHRLLANAGDLSQANAVIAVAGMEGALASVVGGLVDCPVIAVPTSVGYGASFHGVAALLAMLNSCASGVSVVNIDNGYGAGYLANMINQRTGKER